MDWISDVQKSLNYIEDNLLENIKIEDISACVHASKDYFPKIFYIVTGFNISEYLRNRRLSLAGQELIATKAKVIDIALKYLYETPESFTKAFSRFHGFTPSDIQTRHTELKIFDPLTIQIHIKDGFNMSKKLISQIPMRQLINNMQGQNYWLNGCMEFLMECLGEDKAYDYWFFSGVTGDSFMQMYSKNPKNMVLCYSHNMTEKALEKAFGACGYNYDYFKDINDGDREALNERIRSYVDQNTPVIARVNDAFHSFAIICGYDNDTFYYILGEEKEPKPYRYDELIFVTDKKAKRLLADTYKKAVMDIPSLITMTETKEYSFGKKAFIDWAESFQNGSFDKISFDDKVWYTHADPSFSCWNMHGTYLCILGTNGCAEGFLREALAQNPDMTFINTLLQLYTTQNRYGFDALIQMEGGFNLKPEVIKNKDRMQPVSDKIIELSKYCDEILNVYKDSDYPAI